MRELAGEDHPQQEGSLTMPDFFEVLRTRRTVRSFTSEPVSQQDLQELIDSAILAPSGMNLQPWAFSVVTRRDVMDKANAIVLGILRSPEAQQRMGERLRETVNAPGYDIFYRAPALIVISADNKVPGAFVDCQLAVENLFLAAHAKRLGTCYMGFLMLAADHPEVPKLLGIPEGFRIAAAAIVGHPDVRPEGAPQRKPARIIWVR
jgi:nitroreductase